jgi:hypothetical protein
MIGFEFTIIDGNIGCTGHTQKAKVNTAEFVYIQDKHNFDNSIELWTIIIGMESSQKVATITQKECRLCDIWDWFDYERGIFGTDKIIAVCIS